MQSPLLDILSGREPVRSYSHPIVGLRTGIVEAEEILTRFKDSEGEFRTVGSLLVDTRIPKDQRARVDLLCIETIFRALARNPVPDHLIFVNIDPLTLETPTFWDRLRPWLWDLAIPPHRIVMEFTEAHALHDLDSLEAYARRLRDLELRIAVDDLGSGVASLSHMARLAPDFVKVDQSLVRDAHRRPYQAALLHALAVFAETMQVGLIAEGIESEEELEAVTAAGVPWGQGFIFGAPTPLRLSLAPEDSLESH
ncbi:MAG: EAL domain-containing protein [Acidobacteria bacterium]|nr:EAL domain-containing protein [Acidobacteriota bacterium]